MSDALKAIPPVVAKNRSNLAFRLRKYSGLFIMLAPGLIWFFIFRYVPMYGIIIAFKKYLPLKGILASQWVGVANFARMLNTDLFIRAFINTLVLSLLRLFISFPSVIIFALLLNEIRNGRFKKSVQTISYLPHFVSWVVIGGVVRELLSADFGLVNWIITLLGGEQINFMISPRYFRGILIVASLWKGIGWGSIVYLAAISGVDPQLYEAAAMDGAGRLRRVLSITVPSIFPIIVILFILRVGHMMEAGFDEVFNLYNPLVYSVADIIDTYAYRVGLINFDYSYATAIGLFKNVIGIILLLLTNAVSKKISDEGVW